MYFHHARTFGNTYVESVSVATETLKLTGFHGCVEIVVKRSRMSHKKPNLKSNEKSKLKMTHNDFGMLLVGGEKLTITHIRLVDGTISFEAEGISQNDYTSNPIRGVTILDPQRNTVHSEPEYEIPKLKTVLVGDKIHFVFNLDPQLMPSVERWVRAE